MTTNYHTPLSTGAPANASTVNNPLGQLDSTLTTTNINLTAVTNDVADLTSDLATTNSNLTTVATDVADLTSDLATTNTNLATVTNDVAGLTTDLASTDATVATLTSGLATTNSNLTAVTSDVADLTSDLATTDTNLTSITNALNILKSGFIGMIFASATDTAPTGMLACDGATYLKSAYPDLYDALDPIYQISGTEFKVPDLRGRTVIGSGTGSELTARTINQNGGAETVSLVKGNIPPHAHTRGGGAHFLVGTASGTGTAALVAGTTVAGYANTSESIVGGSDPVTSHENMPPFRVLNYWIVATL